MVLKEICCIHCKSKDIIKNGKSPNGKQKYKCKVCNKQSRENPSINSYSEEEKEIILKAYEEHSSFRGLKRIFWVASQTVSG